MTPESVAKAENAAMRRRQSMLKIMDHVGFVPDAEVKNQILQIVTTASKSFGVPYRSVLGVRKSKSLVAARHAAMFQAYEEGYTLQEIGAVMKRDHTTVSAAVKKVRKAAEKGKDTI